MHSIHVPLNFLLVHHQCNPRNETRTQFIYMHSFFCYRSQDGTRRTKGIHLLYQKSFRTKHRCTDHIRNYHSETQPSETVCNFCNKRVGTKSNLRNHVALIHMAEQKFECDVHRKGNHFHLKKDKNSQTRQHHGVAKLMCNKCCLSDRTSGPETKLLMDLNRNIAQVQTSCWNYHYSAGTATGGLGTTSPENFAFSVERGKACKYFFIQERLIRAQFTRVIMKGFHC